TDTITLEKADTAYDVYGYNYSELGYALSGGTLAVSSKA
ncbi:unnamed protein product, partial [marine sediment metagenome]